MTSVDLKQYWAFFADDITDLARHLELAERHRDQLAAVMKSSEYEVQLSDHADLKELNDIVDAIRLKMVKLLTEEIPPHQIYELNQSNYLGNDSEKL